MSLFEISQPYSAKFDKTGCLLIVPDNSEIAVPAIERVAVAFRRSAAGEPIGLCGLGTPLVRKTWFSSSKTLPEVYNPCSAERFGIKDIRCP